jgi:hypothetical protein
VGGNATGCFQEEIEMVHSLEEEEVVKKELQNNFPTRKVSAK